MYSRRGLKKYKLSWGHADIKTTRRYLLDETDYEKAKTKGIKKDLAIEYPKLVGFLENEKF